MAHIDDGEALDPVEKMLRSTIAEYQSATLHQRDGGEGDNICSRAQIDTSAPFESVMQAASRFGEIGFWKPRLPKLPDPQQIVTELDIKKKIVEEFESKPKTDASGDVSNNREPEVDSPSPESILKELKLAKLNLTRTTNDIAEIRASICSYSRMIEEERMSLEKTLERLILNTVYIATLEEEMKGENEASISVSDSSDISRELKRLSEEGDVYKQMEEAAKCEALTAISEIDLIRRRIKAAEIQILAAMKVKEAGKAAKRSGFNVIAVPSKKTMEVTLPFEAEEISKRRIVEAMDKVDEANISRGYIMKKLDDAMIEVRSSRMTLEETLDKEESANIAKLAAEEALRRWRSDRNTHRRPSIHHSRRLKNSYPFCSAEDLNFVDDLSTRSTLCIGDILRRKLLREALQRERRCMRRKVSAGKMVQRSSGEEDKGSKSKRLPRKRHKFGLPRLSALLRKESRKMMNRAPTCIQSSWS